MLPLPRILVSVLLLGILANPSQALKKYKILDYPTTLNFSALESAYGDHNLGMRFPCFIFVINNRDGAKRVPEWKNYLKKQYPRIPIYGVAGLRDMPKLIQPMTTESLKEEPLVYLYDWNGNLNEQVFVTLDIFTEEKIKPPGLVLLMMDKTGRLQREPWEINNYTSFGDTLKEVRKFF
jgi:hypothetical protein